MIEGYFEVLINGSFWTEGGLKHNLKQIIWRRIYMALREKCLYSELFWSAFSRIWTEYGEMRSISPYSVRMPENADQSNSEYGHFLRSVS